MRLFGRFSNTVCTLEPPKLVGGGDWAYISHTWDLSTVSVFLIVINLSLLVNQFFFSNLAIFSDFPIFFNLTIFSIWHFLNKKKSSIFVFNFIDLYFSGTTILTEFHEKKLQFSRQKKFSESGNFFLAWICPESKGSSHSASAW